MKHDEKKNLEDYRKLKRVVGMMVRESKRDQMTNGAQIWLKENKKTFLKRANEVRKRKVKRSVSWGNFILGRKH